MFRKQTTFYVNPSDATRLEYSLQSGDVNDILTITCETVGVDKKRIADKRKIDKTYQMARIVFCRAAFGKFSYAAIGRKINRARQNVCHNVKKAPSDWGCDNAVAAVWDRMGI